MKIAKLARVIGLGTLVGALSLGGVFYASEYDSIEEAILALRLKAESWQKQAGLNKAELNEMTDKYNTLEANYKAVLDILNIEDGSDIEEVKAKVEEIYKNATSTGIEGTNIMLEAIADALGITLTDEDMNENGVYRTDKILEELSKLEDELDKLEEAIGDLSVNLEAGDMEYSDDMSLTEKINYLIGQINMANDEQQTIKALAEETLAEVEEASADYVYVEEEEELPPTEGEDNVVEGEGADEPTIEGEEATISSTEYKLASLMYGRYGASDVSSIGFELNESGKYECTSGDFASAIKLNASSVGANADGTFDTEPSMANILSVYNKIVSGEMTSDEAWALGNK